VSEHGEKSETLDEHLNHPVGGTGRNEGPPPTPPRKKPGEK
jgi:hypothetical protein